MALVDIKLLPGRKEMSILNVFRRTDLVQILNQILILAAREKLTRLIFTAGRMDLAEAASKETSVEPFHAGVFGFVRLFEMNAFISGFDWLLAMR